MTYIMIHVSRDIHKKTDVFLHFIAAQTAFWEELHHYFVKDIYISWQPHGKSFNNLSQGVQYSSMVKGLLDFCSDKCYKNYINLEPKI